MAPGPRNRTGVFCFLDQFEERRPCLLAGNKERERERERERDSARERAREQLEKKANSSSRRTPKRTKRAGVTVAVGGQTYQVGGCGPASVNSLKEFSYGYVLFRSNPNNWFPFGFPLKPTKTGTLERRQTLRGCLLGGCPIYRESFT